MSVEHYRLSRFRRRDSPRGATITTVRDLSAAEVERTRRALVVLGTMNGNNLIRPLVDATSVLGSLVAHILEHPAERANDFELRQEWSAALDVWLVHLPLVRRRLERDIQRALGDEAHDHAQAAFAAAYRTGAHYRLAWEWRNIAQHHADPLELTSVSSRAQPGGRPQTEWRFSPASASLLPSSTPDMSRSLVVDGTPCWDVIDRAVKDTEAVLRDVVLRSEEVIASEAEWLLGVVAEVLASGTGTPQAPISPVIATEDGPGSFSILPLPFDLAGSALLTLDAAREQTGLPRAHTPPPST